MVGAKCSFVCLKIHELDRAVYFSAVPSPDWSVSVDARPSGPQRRASSEASEDSSDDLGSEEEDEQTAYAREKHGGKRLADEDHLQKEEKWRGRPVEKRGRCASGRRSRPTSETTDGDLEFVG